MKTSMTVLITNYNHGRYLRECVASLHAQTCRDWTAVVVDDGSTDSSREIYATLCEDDRVKVVLHTVNQGKIAALRTGIAAIEKGVVVILDADDALEPTAIAELMAVYDVEPDVGVVYANHWVCDADLMPRKKGFSRGIPPGSSALARDCVSHLVSFRVEAYRQTAGYEEAFALAEDKDIILKLEEVTALRFIPRELYRYRVLKQSMSHGGNRRLARTRHKAAQSAARQRRRRSGQALGWMDRFLLFLK